jgi:hypothetical protein
MTQFRPQSGAWKISQYSEQAPGKTTEDSVLDAGQGQAFTESRQALGPTQPAIKDCGAAHHYPIRLGGIRSTDIRKSPLVLRLFYKNSVYYLLCCLGFALNSHFIIITSVILG